METSAPACSPYSAPPMCPECGYLLQGLPAEGKCPECGLIYDRDHLVIYAWPQTGHLKRHPTYLQPIGLLLVIVTLYTLRQGFWIRSFLPWFGTFAPRFPEIAFLLAFGASILWLRHMRRKLLRTIPAPLQVRLSAEGFSIRQGIGKVNLRLWVPTTRFKIESTHQNRTVFALTPRHWTLAHTFDCDLSALAAKQLQEMVARWIAASSDASST